MQKNNIDHPQRRHVSLSDDRIQYYLLNKKSIQFLVAAKRNTTQLGVEFSNESALSYNELLSCNRPLDIMASSEDFYLGVLIVIACL